MDDRIELGMREVDRLRVMQRVLDGSLTQVAAAKQLTLSDRQVRRLGLRVAEHGARGLIHGLRGRPSNHQLAVGLLDKALTLVQARYPDFGPTFACEKLAQRHGLCLSDETLRRGMLQAGLWRGRHHDPPYRAWRERRATRGELVQLDGSEHAWFEGRGPTCALVTYVDDAGSELLYGAFIPVESTLGLFRTTRTYLRREGRPLAFYVDRDGIYRVNRQSTVEEELRDEAPLSQFARAMRHLGIDLVFAQSPQAKGRVERGFGTHQDRLVKELRLARVSDPVRATAFLNEVYRPDHNRRCAVAPRGLTDAHRPLLRTHDLDSILSLQTPRQVQHDFTVRYHGQWFQLAPAQPVRVRPKMTIWVEERLEGSVHLRLKGRDLQARPLPARPRQLRAADERRWPTPRSHAA